MAWHKLNGQKFGRLTVIEKIKLDKYKEKRWKCLCECGNYTYPRTQQLTHGITKSCGCLKKELQIELAQKTFKDITGQKFHKLLALERVAPPPHRKQNKRVFWKCLCDCGNYHIVDGGELRNGSTKSCGCLRHKELGEAALNALFYSYRTSGKRRLNKKLVFEITKEDFKILTKQNCFYCGKEPSTVSRSYYGEYIYNGLDRVDNDIGYNLSNVVTCCHQCNFMKGSKTQEDFIDFLKRVTNHWKDRV